MSELQEMRRAIAFFVGLFASLAIMVVPALVFARAPYVGILPGALLLNLLWVVPEAME